MIDNRRRCIVGMESQRPKHEHQRERRVRRGWEPDGSNLGQGRRRTQRTDRLLELTVLLVQARDVQPQRAVPRVGFET